MTSVTEIGPGDYVKVGPNRYCEIAAVYGIKEDGRLRKPSEGFFGVTTPSGRAFDGWSCLAYVRRADLPPDARVER